MWRVKKTRIPAPRRFEDLKNSVGDLVPILDLVHNPDLHVIHNQSQARRVANVFQCLRNI